LKASPPPRATPARSLVSWLLRASLSDLAPPARGQFLSSSWASFDKLGARDYRCVTQDFPHPKPVEGRTFGYAIETAAIVTRPLLVIDGDSFAHRAYHALPKSLRSRGGKGGGAILGFANFLLKLYADEQPRAVLAAWDTLETPTWRQQALPDYQGGRVFDDELVDQLKVLPRLVLACGFAIAKAPGYEADDFLAAAATGEEKRGGTAIVASGDRDAFQLASERTTILQPLRAGEMARIDPAGVRERYGVEPHQVPDFIALRGDPSDKIPGAKGVGPKGAAALLEKYGTLEEALADPRLSGQEESLRLYRKIATMNAAAPLPPLPDQTPTWTRAAALARDWELNRLADRLAALA